MDIVIYTNPDTLADKQGKNGKDFCYWEFLRFPTMVYRWDRVYFAVKGKVVGSFKIDIVRIASQQIEWTAALWKPLKKKIACKPFRGFRYKWWKD